MPINLLRLLLADDDKDDCLFFQEALAELSISSTLTYVHDGDQLMQILNHPFIPLPDVLFMDVNMPRKNGLECLTEIRLNEKFKNLPVIMYSTSYEQNISNQLYYKGATYFIQKPSDFGLLKKIIFKALSLIAEKNSNQPGMENFLLNKESAA